MEYVNLGRSGLKVSRICLGTMTYGTSAWRDWVLDEEESRPFIRRALELGVNFFDTADMYSRGVSEEVVGRALKDFANREDFVLATKVYFPVADRPNRGGLSRKHILSAIDASLRRLGTDYVDLYQIHRWDYETPVEETMEALHDVVKAGKARYIGASSMYAWQFARAQFLAARHGWTRFISMQNHYNLIYREEEREMNPFCIEEGVGVIPWSPLARGVLSGNRRRGGEERTARARTDGMAKEMYRSESDYDIVDRVIELAERYQVTSSQLALAWLLQQPVVTSPIIGASKMHHLEEAVAATEITLTPDDLEYLEELYEPHPIAGHS